MVKKKTINITLMKWGIIITIIWVASRITLDWTIKLGLHQTTRSGQIQEAHYTRIREIRDGR